MPDYLLHLEGWLHPEQVSTASCRYEDDAWEILLGYDQEKSMGERAGAALVEDLRTVDRQGRTPADDV